MHNVRILNIFTNKTVSIDTQYHVWKSLMLHDIDQPNHERIQKFSRGERGRELGGGGVSSRDNFVCLGGGWSKAYF